MPWGLGGAEQITRRALTSAIALLLALAPVSADAGKKSKAPEGLPVSANTLAGGAPSRPADRLPRTVWTAVGISRKVCFTVLNEGDLLETQLAKGGADLIGAVVLSDETRTVCADADEARVDCADDTPKCRFWWRVDEWF